MQWLTRAFYRSGQKSQGLQGAQRLREVPSEAKVQPCPKYAIYHLALVPGA